MKFPITRESLQAFDPIQENNDDSIIQTHINSLVKDICHAFETIMSFTMTVRLPTPITKCLIHRGTTCVRNEQYAHQMMMTEKRFVWKELHTIRKPKCGGNDIDVDESILIPLLIEELKENFIGCNIIVDPLNTYIIIDWS
jgi:hypothetical protein